MEEIKKAIEVSEVSEGLKEGIESLFPKFHSEGLDISKLENQSLNEITEQIARKRPGGYKESPSSLPAPG